MILQIFFYGFLFLLLSLVLFLAFFIFYPSYKYRKLNKLPGPPAHWLFGNSYFDTPHARMMRNLKYVETYGDIFRLWYTPLFVIYFNSPEAIKDVMRSSINISKSQFYDTFLQGWLGLGLLTSTGEMWKKQRRMLTPAFHFKILKGYVDITSHQVDIFNELMLSKNGEFINIVPFISHLTLDIIGLSVFGVSINAQKDPSSEYVTSVGELAKATIYRIKRFWLHPDFIYKFTSHGKKTTKLLQTVHNFSESVIREQQKNLTSEPVVEEKEEKYSKYSSNLKSFVRILIETKDEEGKPLSFQEIRDQVDTFMFEGHDTTANGISWTLYLLASYPEILKKAQEESDTIYGNREYITHEDLSSFEYLKMIINESHRLYPPVPSISRRLSEGVTIKEYYIPKGTNVNIAVFNLHRNPSVWGIDVNEFKPERFSKENCENRDSFAFIPFSAGPRNCIGQNFAFNEEIIVLSKIIRTFDLKLDPNHKVELENRLTLAPSNGIKISFIPRDKK